MLKDYAEVQSSAFIIHTGDICYEDGMKFHSQNVITSTMGLPVYYTVGNHDLVKGDYGEQLYEALFGPVYYSFDVGNYHFIVTPMPHGDYQPGYTQEDVYRWLINDLAQVDSTQAIMVFNHDLLMNDGQFLFKGDNQAVNLEEYNLKAWVYGHWHNHLYRPHKNSEVVSICTSPPNKGGIDYSIAAFRVFDINADQSFSTELVHSYVDHEVHIASPAPHTSIQSDGAFSIIVNAYNSTAPVTKINYSLQNNVSKSLRQVSNWSWMASEQADPKWKDKDTLQMSIEGIFGDGQIRRSERSFTLYKNESSRTKGQWNNFLLNPNRNPNLNNNFILPMKLNWVFNIGQNIYHSSPIIGDGKLFIAGMDEGDVRNSGILAYHEQSGKNLWKANTNNVVKHSVAYSNERIFAVDITGMLYSFEANTG